MSKLRKPTRTSLKKKADRAFAVAIKARDGDRCVECGSRDFVQCAHIVSRRYMATRYDPDNAVALCRSHHMKYTVRPLEWRCWVEGRFGDGHLRKLELKALIVTKNTDYQEVIDRFQDCRRPDRPVASFQSQEDEARNG